MTFGQYWFCVSCSWLLLCKTGYAQQLPAWPRNQATGRIELVGLLPWPTPQPTRAQQQALARRWYQTKLTSEKPAQLTSHAAVTFAGLPDWAYLDSVHYAPDNSGVIDSLYGRVIWRLGYRVKLTPTPAGLAYHLSEFEGFEIGYDAGNSEALETLLTRYAKEQAVFYRRLRRALAGW